MTAGNYGEQRAEKEIRNSSTIYHRFSRCFSYSSDINFLKKEHLAVFSAIPGISGKRLRGLCMGSASLDPLLCLRRSLFKEIFFLGRDQGIVEEYLLLYISGLQHPLSRQSRRTGIKDSYSSDGFYRYSCSPIHKAEVLV